MAPPVAAHSVNVADGRGLSFACQPGCGFCCTANPLVLPHEAPALGARVVRMDDGTLRIPLGGSACSALRPDMSCGVYLDRPSVCRLYPFQVHAGRRIQVTVSMGCPGVSAGAFEPHGTERSVHPAPDAEPDVMDSAAREAADIALAQPEAAKMAQQARETYAELDRRMKEWGVEATPDRLRAAFLPHLASLARPERLPTFFAGLEPGDLVLDPKPARAVEALFASEPTHALPELLLEAARDAFDDPEAVLWVARADFAWTKAHAQEDRVRLTREKEGATRAPVDLDVATLPVVWSDPASAALAAYLERLCRRDQTEGAALWLVDASGYQVTPAAAFGRVLGEAALQVVLRAGLLAAERGAAEVDAQTAREAISAYETSYHSLPTIGAVL